MEVIISFFLGSMVLFQILMGIAVIGLILSALSPNMREHISHFLGNKSKKEPEPSQTTPPSPFNITPQNEGSQLPQIEKPRPQIITLRLDIPDDNPPVVAQPSPSSNIAPSHYQPPVKQNISRFEPDVSAEVPSVIREIKKEKIEVLALQLSGLDQDDIYGMDYMEEDDPRILQYKFALIMAKHMIEEQTQSVIFKCPLCHNGRLLLQKKTFYTFWHCNSCTNSYPNRNGIPAVYIPIPADNPPIQEQNILVSHPIWVKLSILDEHTGIYSGEYSYFLGKIKDVHVGDNVIIYVKHGKERKIAKVNYISNCYEMPPPKAKSPISGKVLGKYIASKKGKKFHTPSCKEVKITDNTIWFQTEYEAMSSGRLPCAKCIL